MGILTDERAALEEYERLFAPGSSEGPKHLRHYGALGLRRGRALARRQIPCTWRQWHPASFSMPKTSWHPSDLPIRHSKS